MTDTTFVDQQTIIQATWCNDINDHVYNDTPISPSTTVHDSSKISNSIKRVANIAAIRSITPVSTYDVETQGYYAAGDGGHGAYYGVTGAAPGTYVDDGFLTIVPTGGNGSSAWKLKTNDIPNVKQAGAKGDGANDDTTSLQSAINSGHNLYIPNGTYKVTSALNFTTYGQTLFGESQTSTIIKQFWNGDVIHLNAAVVFKNFQVLGQKATYAAGTGINITTASMNGIYMESIICSSFSEYGVYDSYPGSDQMTMLNCQTNSNTLDGIYLQGVGNNLTGHQSNSNGRDGIVIDGATNSVVRPSCYQNGRYQIATGTSYGNEIVSPNLWVPATSSYSPILLACRQSKVDMTGGQVWQVGLSLYDVQIDRTAPSIIGAHVTPTGILNTLVGVLRVLIPSGSTGTTCINSGGVAFVDNDATQSTTRVINGQLYFGGVDAARSPCFVAYPGSNQIISTGVATKVAYNTASLNINNNYDAATNYRFTPLSAGRYFVKAIVYFTDEVNATYIQLDLRKNGGVVKSHLVQASGTGAHSCEVSGIITFNGTTDYVEAFVTQNSGGNRTILGVDYVSSFEAFKIMTYPV